MQREAPAVDPEQVMLNPAVFRDMRHSLKFKPSADMFASATHLQLPRYYSKNAADLLQRVWMRFGLIGKARVRLTSIRPDL